MYGGGVKQFFGCMLVVLLNPLTCKWLQHCKISYNIGCQYIFDSQVEWSNCSGGGDGNIMGEVLVIAPKIEKKQGIVWWWDREDGGGGDVKSHHRITTQVFFFFCLKWNRECWWNGGDDDDDADDDSKLLGNLLKSSSFFYCFAHQTQDE